MSKKVLVHSMAEAVRVAFAMGPTAHVTVLHDDCCSPSRCSCSPDYVVEPLTAEAAKRGAELQAKWVKDTMS